MSDWFRAFFGEPEPQPGVCDCDDCKAANPDWYRMGMQPRKPKPRDLSRVEPRRFLDSLLWLREHRQEDAADQSSGQSVEQWLTEKRTATKKGKRGSLFVGGTPIGTTDFYFSTASGGNWSIRPAQDDDEGDAT